MLGGVGSHDIGGVIDGEVVAEVLPEDVPVAAAEVTPEAVVDAPPKEVPLATPIPEPPVMPDNFVALDDIKSELSVPPVVGEWKEKGDNKWFEKDKYWVGLKRDPTSRKLPRMGGGEWTSTCENWWKPIR